MADVDLTVEAIDRDGLEATFAGIDNVDTYYTPRKGGAKILHFKNTGGGIATITFDITQTVDGATLVDPTVAIPATTGDVMVANLGAIYEVETGVNKGKLKFACDQAAGVTVAALEV